MGVNESLHCSKLVIVCQDQNCTFTSALFCCSMFTSRRSLSQQAGTLREAQLCAGGSQLSWGSWPRLCNLTLHLGWRHL